MTNIYLVRHGETEYNKKGCYYGWTDCGLSQLGIEQSEALKTAFNNIEYDIMLCSDLRRAVETANIINSTKELIIDKRLRELNFGLWEGLSHQVVMAQYKEHWTLWLEDWVNAVPTEGESVIAMYQRICQCMDEVLNKYKDKSIVIAAHNGSLRMIAVYLMELALEKLWCFSFEHGRYSLMEINEGHCTIKSINNI